MLVEGGSIIVARDLRVRNNRATAGAGVFLSGSMASFDKAWFENNTATNFGGAIFVQFSELSLTHATIHANQVGTNGCCCKELGTGVVWTYFNRVSS